MIGEDRVYDNTLLLHKRLSLEEEKEHLIV